MTAISIQTMTTPERSDKGETFTSVSITGDNHLGHLSLGFFIHGTENLKTLREALVTGIAELDRAIAFLEQEEQTAA